MISWIKSFLITFSLGSSLWANSSVFIEERSINPHGLKHYLKEALAHSELKWVEAADLEHKTMKVLINTFNNRPGRVSHVVHLTLHKDRSYKRMLTYDKLKSEWMGMDESSKNIYFRHMAFQLVDQLEVEAELREGDKLEAGYFTNLTKVSVSPESSKLPPNFISTPTETTKKSLHVDLVRTTPAKPKTQAKPSLSPKAKSSPIDSHLVKGYVIHRPIHGDRDKLLKLLSLNLDKVNAKVLENFFQESEAIFDQCQPKEQSQLRYKQALAYLNIGDSDEAIEVLNDAISLDPKNHQAKRLQKSLMPTKPSPIERWRNYNKRNKLKVSLGLKAEHDSNILLEEKDPIVPTDKNDFIMSYNLGMSKNWVKNHSSSYNFFTNTHAENETFNLMAHSLSHAYQTQLNPKTLLILPLSFSHFSLDAKKLLWNTDLSPLFIYRYDKGWSATFQLGYRSTSYFDSANSGLESTQWRAKANIKRALPNRQFLSAGGGLTDEGTEDKTLAYTQPSLDFGYESYFDHYVFEYFKFGAHYHFRTYEEMAAIATKKRKNLRYTFDLETGKSITEYQTLKFNLSYIDNQSNQSATAYDKFKINMSWKIDI